MHQMSFQNQSLHTNKSVNKFSFGSKSLFTPNQYSPSKIALQKCTEETQPKPPQLSPEISQANLTGKIILNTKCAKRKQILV